MYQLEHQKMVDSLAIVKVKMPSLLLKLQVCAWFESIVIFMQFT
jgi:hypothetical protein